MITEHTIRLVRSRSGSGLVTNVLIDNVVVWGWAHHIDGPLPVEVQQFLDVLAEYVGYDDISDSAALLRE